VSGDPLETSYLFQRLSVAIQRGNEVSFAGTYRPLTVRVHMPSFLLLNNNEGRRQVAFGAEAPPPKFFLEEKFNE